MTWGVWVEWGAFNDGHEKPAGRAWLREDDAPLLFTCEQDAIQRAAIYRANKTERGWQGYMAENLQIVQARKYTPTCTLQQHGCEPDLTSLTGWLR